ncbi:hypothetical protein JKP88DRAFT_302636 [Tribonema minus]|uniref:Uncharacterized protein n=1 Tax=Tribonema minus TaxID=303371 RepID=A0A836CMQ6_9STRA|nr:hypothetical protein JKP88DRAFT_302636 [Tribonema minus]
MATAAARRPQLTTGPAAMCSRCTTRPAAISCCSTALCLRHFHTSEHASAHPSKATVINQEAADLQHDDFARQWKATFESVQADIEQITEQMEAVSNDPLGAIGMMPTLNKAPSAGVLAAEQRMSRKPSSNSATIMSAAAMASTAAMPPPAAPGGSGGGGSGDVSKRRKPSRTTYWAVGDPSTGVLRGSRYRCDVCHSDNTIFSSIGGDGGQTRKGETWGNKEAAALMVRIDCRNCGRSWTEEY